MSRRPRRPTFADLLAEVRASPPAVPEVPWHGGAEAGLLRYQGERWGCSAADLHRDEVLDLLGSADLVVRGWVGGAEETDRAEARSLVERRFAGPGGELVGKPWPAEPVYTAHLFTDVNRRTLLYLDTHC